jgi:lipoprotein-anchoring transpeptidase ErfK/SrfK
MGAVKHRDDRPRRARRRIAAVGASATVTVLSVGGVFGLVPGAQGTTLVHGSQFSSGDISSPLPANGMPGDITAGHPTGFSTPAEDAIPVDASTTSDPAQDPTSQALAYPIPTGTGSGKRIVFDLSEQRVWLVDAHDQLARTYLGSGSRYDNLHSGRFEVYSKSRYALSYDYRETMQYMVRFDHGDTSPLGFHTIPVDSSGRLVQTVKQLGTPLSAGCIRQAVPDAKALWKFAPIGTDVWIVA